MKNYFPTKSMIAACLLVSSQTLFSTGVTFTAESGEVFVGSTPANSATAGDLNLSGLAFFVEDSAFSDFVNDESFGVGGDISTSQLSDIIATLDAASGASYTTLTKNTGSAIDSFDSLFSIFGSQDAGAAGFHAVMIVHDGISLDGLEAGNNLGVVATTSPTLGLGSFTVGFNTSKSWDTTLVGDSGSLTLASVVPEPSAFALIAGCFGLALAMVRRRV